MGFGRGSNFGAEQLQIVRACCDLRSDDKRGDVGWSEGAMCEPITGAFVEQPDSRYYTPASFRATL